MTTIAPMTNLSIGSETIERSRIGKAARVGAWVNEKRTIPDRLISIGGKFGQIDGKVEALDFID